MPSAVAVAALDQELMPSDLRVYVYLYGRLDYTDYRSIKHRGVARDVYMSRVNVVRAIGRLLERGYLVQGPPDGSLRTYRLTASPLTREAPAA